MTDWNYLVATVDHLGFHAGAIPAERVRQAQHRWRRVRRILKRSDAEYLREESDTVIVRFADHFTASRTAAEIRDGLDEPRPLEGPAGINVSLGREPDIDSLLEARRDTALVFGFGRLNWTISRAMPVLRIGRDAGNDICLFDETSSREHARVEFRGDHHVLIDCSLNGTVLKDVSGERLIVGGEIGLPRAGIICCSRVYFGDAYPESILFGPPEGTR